jgi:transcriptional regulator GlxA family with amidase domain
MRVLDVAIGCGFKNRAHLARGFRQVCGASPSEYRTNSWFDKLPELQRSSFH